jgi:hypothetical protein
MSLSKKKLQKRKQREKEVRKKVLARREELRVERKELEKERQREREMWLLEHGKPQPAVSGNPEIAAKKLADRAQNAAEKLQHNLEILKALEAEYEKEQASRTELNEKLEAEGYKTMKEKMAAMHEKALKMKEVLDMQAEAAKEKAEKEALLEEKS